MSWDVTTQTYLESNAPRTLRQMFWTTVTPIGGGAAVSLGYWTGEDHRSITVEGSPRLYFGAQGAIGCEPIPRRAGTAIASVALQLGLTPEGEALLRGYAIANAPIEIHWAVFDASMNLVGIDLRFRGFIDTALIPTPPPGEAAILPLTLASSARRGTQTRGGKKSNASQVLRSAGDRFREYGDLGVRTNDPWGNLT